MAATYYFRGTGMNDVIGGDRVYDNYTSVAKKSSEQCEKVKAQLAKTEAELKRMKSFFYNKPTHKSKRAHWKVK